MPPEGCGTSGCEGSTGARVRGFLLPAEELVSASHESVPEAVEGKCLCQVLRVGILRRGVLLAPSVKGCQSYLTSVDDQQIHYHFIKGLSKHCLQLCRMSGAAKESARACYKRDINTS